MFFSPFYELFENLLGLYDSKFAIVFQTLFKSGGYNSMGFTLFLVPLVCLLLFYFIWRYPYGTIWHWLLYIGVIAIVVGGIVFSLINSSLAKFLIHSNPLVVSFTESIVLSYAILNACLSLIVSFIYSLILKRFSKIQMHLPF